MPADSVAVLPLVAEPPLTATGEPKLVPSILNCTVPVAVFGVTVAVKLTEFPNVEGFNDELTAVLLLAWFTT